MSSHQFSFFLPAESYTTTQTHLLISDKEIVRRVKDVIRLRIGESVTFFCATHVYYTRIEQYPAKNQLRALREDTVLVRPADYPFSIVIGLLKKPAFEEAVYYAAATGAQSIIPIITERSRQKWSHDHEPERLQSILVSACEQSKSYTIPHLHNPCSLPSLWQPASPLPSASTLLFFDPRGKALSHFSQNYAPSSHTTLLIGPEGGWSDEEYTMVSQKSSEIIALTPTILRAKEAVLLASGVIASLHATPTTS